MGMSQGGANLVFVRQDGLNAIERPEGSIVFREGQGV